LGEHLVDRNRRRLRRRQQHRNVRDGDIDRGRRQGRVVTREYRPPRQPRLEYNRPNGHATNRRQLLDELRQRQGQPFADRVPSL